MTDRAPFAIKFAVPFAASPLNSSLLVIQSPPPEHTRRYRTMNYLVKRLEPAINASVLNFSASADNVPTLSPKMNP
jgi:hypothetical protein